MSLTFIAKASRRSTQGDPRYGFLSGQSVVIEVHLFIRASSERSKCLDGHLLGRWCGKVHRNWSGTPVTSIVEVTYNKTPEPTLKPFKVVTGVVVFLFMTEAVAFYLAMSRDVACLGAALLAVRQFSG